MSKWRARFAIIFLVLGTLLLPIGVVGHWGHTTFNDTNRFVSTVAPLTQIPEVQNAIADSVTESLITPEAAAAQVEEWFPRAPKGLVNTVATAVVSKVNELIRKLVATPQFATAWALMNSKVQQAFIAVLQNNPPPSLSMQDGNIVLNLDILGENVRDRVAQEGINLPQINSDKIPSTVVLAKDVQLKQVRGIYSWSSPLLQWFFLLPVALLVLSVLMSPNMARGLRRSGYGVLIAAGILAILLVAGVNLLNPAFDGTPFEPAEQPMWNTLTAYLARGTWIVAGIGVLLMVVGFVWERSQRKKQYVEVVEVEEVEVVEPVPTSSDTTKLSD